jgi:hypothetical protein
VTALRVAALAALACLAAEAGRAQSLAVTGLDGKAHVFDAAELAALPQAEASLKAKDGPTHVYRGPVLSSLLQAAGAPSGKALRGPDMADVVLVSGKDGYRVAFGLAETEASIRAGAMLVALTEDGKAFDDTEGPLRLVVAGDLRPARSVRMVAAVKVIRPPD